MKKKSIVFLLMALSVIGLASGALVTYISNSITTEVAVESPIELSGDEFSFDITTAGEDGFALIQITNNAAVDITGDVEIRVDKDIVGISMAVTEDINYCFKGQGDLTGIIDCKTEYMTWMAQNIDWNDWYANNIYSDAEYPSSLVLNTNGDSFYQIGYTGNALILPDQTIPAASTIYAVIYVATNLALQPDTYNFEVIITP